MKKKQPEKRFGVVAMEKGFITAVQLLEAMRVQITEDIELQNHRPIGAILLDQEAITGPQLNEVLRAMNIPVLEDEW